MWLVVLHSFKEITLVFIVFFFFFFTSEGRSVNSSLAYEVMQENDSTLKFSFAVMLATKPSLILG